MALVTSKTYEQKTKAAMEKAKANDKANVDAARRVPSGTRVVGSNAVGLPAVESPTIVQRPTGLPVVDNRPSQPPTVAEQANPDLAAAMSSMRQRAALETGYTLPKASDPPGTTRLGGSAPSIEPERETPQALRNLGERLANKWTKGATTAEEANRAARDTSIDFLEAIPAAVQRGADQFYTGVTGAVDMLLGQPLQALGWENNPISNWNASAQAEAEGNATKWGERIDNSGARAIADVGSQVVAALPDAALAFLSGGTSLAPQAAAQTTRGLQAASAAARAADAVGDFARGLGASGRVAGALTDAASVAIPAATEMLSNPQYWLSYAQTAGSGFNQARAEGADAAKATAYATVNGLLGAIVEMGGGIQTLPSELRQSPSQVKAWLDGMIDEGGEEIVQGVIDRLSQNVTGLANNALFSVADENAVFNPVTAAQEGAMGALVGGIVGGGQVLVNNAINNAAQRRAQRDFDAFLETAGIGTQAQPEAVVAPESAPIQEQAQTVAPESQPVQEAIQESPVAPESAPAQEPLVEHTPVAVEAQAGGGTASVVERLRAAIPQLQNTSPVAEVQGNEIPQDGSIVDRLVSFASRIGNKVTRAGFGDVLFSRSRIKNSFRGHGYGSAKIETFAAVPAVIQNGAQIAHEPNWKGRSYDTYIFAAPITYRGNRTYLAAVVTRDANDGRYYLHEVIGGDGNIISPEIQNQQESHSTGNATQTGAFYTGTTPAGNNIIADANQNVNTNNVFNVMSDEQLLQEQQQAASGVGPESSVGAASAGFVDPESARLTEQYQSAVDTYGALPERPNLARQMEVPASMDGETVVPRTVQTALGSEATSSEAVGAITDEVARGGFSRAVITDRASLARAERTITENGFQRALADWTATVRSGKVSKDTTTLGLTLYNNAINAGNVNTGIQILTDIVDNARTAAQATQAMNILNKLSPEGRLYGIQRTVSNLQQELERKYGDLAPGLKIDERLAADFLNAADEDARLAALNELYKDIANQVPQSWYDKLNAWRYFSMLFNPRTHIRNVFGNAVMSVANATRNRISSGLQRAFVRDTSQRTRQSINRSENAEDDARYQVGYAEYKRVSEMLGDAGKYSNELNQIRRHMRSPFKGVLGKVMDFGSGTLEYEDVLFSRRAYASNLAQFLKARGITAEQYMSGSIGQEAKAEAQAYAISEAQKATFRDFNAFSNLVSKLANLGGDTGVGRAWQTFMGANLPFTRTPANIIVRGVVDYSPIGMIRGFGNLLTDVKRGDMTAGEAVDQISGGLVGTALLGLGALLSHLGYVTGGESDDEQQQALDELRGVQPYSLQIGGNSYTLDWLAPSALPFFTGVEIQKLFGGEGSGNFSELLQAIGGIADPMLEMSMLSSVSDLLENVAYSDGNGLWPILASTATNYISQFFPSVFGSLERLFENERSTTYTNPDSWIPTDFQYAISQAANRFPGEYNQLPFIDALGQRESTGAFGERALENFLSPGYYSRVETTAVLDELQRIYEATGENVAPQRVSPNYSFKRTLPNGEIETVRLSEHEGMYETYATTLGQTTANELAKLFGSATYQSMSSEEQAAAIKDIEDYAEAMARKAVNPDYELERKDQEASEFGAGAPAYFLFDNAWKTIEDSKGADAAAFDAVMQDYSAMDAEQQEAITTLLGENSRFDDVVEAYGQGVEPAKWYGVYDKYKEINAQEGLSAADKATEFAHWLQTSGDYSTQERNLFRDQFAFYSMMRGDAERFDALRQAGLSSDQSYEVYDAVNALVPKPGKTQVSNQQRYEAIAGLSSLDETEKVAALTEYEGASSGDKLRFETAYNMGVSPELYVDMLGLKADGYGDADGNGSYKQAEAKTLIDHMLDTYDEMTNSEAAVLWAMICSSSKGGNPYGNVYSGTMDWKYAQ